MMYRLSIKKAKKTKTLFSSKKIDGYKYRRGNDLYFRKNQNGFKK